MRRIKLYFYYSYFLFLPFGDSLVSHASSGEKFSSVTPPATANIMEARQRAELDNKKYQSLESFSKVLNLLEANYVDPSVVNPDLLIEKALKGMTADLD